VVVDGKGQIGTESRNGVFRTFSVVHVGKSDASFKGQDLLMKRALHDVAAGKRNVMPVLVFIDGKVRVVEIVQPATVFVKTQAQVREEAGKGLRLFRSK